MPIYNICKIHTINVGIYLANNTRDLRVMHPRRLRNVHIHARRQNEHIYIYIILYNRIYSKCMSTRRSRRVYNCAILRLSRWTQYVYVYGIPISNIDVYFFFLSRYTRNDCYIV